MFGMGNTFTPPIFRFLHAIKLRAVRRESVCANCKELIVPGFAIQGSNWGYLCSDECSIQWEESWAI